ncbi:MAG: hypothetical protein JST06_06960 [Bacteroidetes bacterium]|nr:hypothetical protein [Bacteroidota bacterium]MBS1629031.1 hypothetical protein [Bacteroidota bacterium]
MKPLLLLLLLCLTLHATAQTKKYAIQPGLMALVQHAAGSNTVQVSLPGVDLIELDLTQPPTHSFQIKTADFNFDGFKDFAFTSRDPAAVAAPVVYDIYLYNADEKSFESPEYPDGAVCGLFSNVRLNAGDKTLRSSCRSGNKTSTDVFRWETPFSLTLLSSVDHSAEHQQEQSEERADRKAEKKDARREARNAREEQRQEQREERKNDEDE